MARLKHHVDAADKERATHTNTEVHDMGRGRPGGKPPRLHPPHRLRYLRRAQGVTLAAVAERIGVTEATAEAWERRQRGIPDHQKVRLAAIFGVTVSFLMGWDEEHRSSRAADPR